MFNCLIITLLLVTPVLHEGRYRPAETLPETTEQEAIENYQTFAGNKLIEAAGKALYYPTTRQLQAELFLYQFPFKWLIIGSYLLAFLFRNKTGWTFLVFGFFLHTLCLALRTFVLSRPPVTSMSETLLYVPWVTLLSALFFRRPFFGAFAATILLLFLPAHQTLETIPPVLDSNYWLTVHVLMVVGSYGIFFFSGVCGHLMLLGKRELEMLVIRSLYLGTALLICGTILGGVWAAQSWGRFWDWDPKEAWAFISSGFYLLTIHAYRFKKIAARGLAVGTILGLVAITFTWYGVNYILGTGLHSYGFGEGGAAFYYLYLAGEALFLIFSTIFFTKNHRLQKKG